MFALNKISLKYVCWDASLQDQPQKLNTIKQRNTPSNLLLSVLGKDKAEENHGRSHKSWNRPASA